MHGDWITATATILATLLGILGGYMLSRYQREKRILRFVVMDTEDLAAALRVHGAFEIKFAHFSTTELVLSTIAVRNLGNCTLKDIQFNLKIPGDHSFAQISCAGENSALAAQVIVRPPIKGGLDPDFPMSLPFLNTGEGFRINALYTGKLSECEITCRLPDTTVQTYTVKELYRINGRRNYWKTFFTLIGGACAALAFGLISKFLKDGFLIWIAPS
jgi:hypothetical protein